MLFWKVTFHQEDGTEYDLVRDAGTPEEAMEWADTLNEDRALRAVEFTDEVVAAARRVYDKILTVRPAEAGSAEDLALAFVMEYFHETLVDNP